jgi:diguanylate cyclase (GGDEF)-like protein
MVAPSDKPTVSPLPAAAEPSPPLRALSAIPDEREELEALHETALGLIDRLDLHDLLQAIVDRAGGLVGTPHGYLYVAAEDSTLEVRVGTGVFEPWVGHTLRCGEGVAGRVWQTREPLVVADYHQWAGRQPAFDSVPFRAVVGVPLRAGGEISGVLGLARVEEVRSFGEAEVALLTRFGRLASLAIENARLYGTAQQELAERLQAEDDLLDTIARLQRSELELQLSQAETIRRLAFAAEFRNAETGRHTERMSRYCELLARRLELDEERCELIRLASGLHDVGKIAIPDRILLKPGRLTDSERGVMERHAEIGHRLLAGSSSELLDVAATIALTHHERYDGTGYPQALAGEAVPLEGRLAGVADVFDAITSNRVYRPAMRFDEAVEVMRAGRGTQFDPLVLDLFLEAIADVRSIAEGRAPEGGSDAPEPRRQADRAPSARQRGRAARPVSVDSIAASVRRAKAAFGTDSGRTSIDLAVDALAAGFNRRVLASVYVLEHERLWLVSQRGYEDIRDGFALDQGVMARAVRTGELQFIEDADDEPDFIAAVSGITSEIAVPFTVGGAVAGVLNIETKGPALPADATGVYEQLAPLVAERIEEMRASLGLDLAGAARLCVHASSLRGVAAITEFATRTLARLLELDSAQVSLIRDGDAYQLASFWRRPDSALRPLEPGDVKQLAEIESRSGAGAAYSVLDSRLPGLEQPEQPVPPWLVWLPLRVAGGEVGALVGRTSAATELGHEQVEAATLFAQHTAALIDVAQALRREQRAAVTDSLTGLLNRRGLEDRLDEELARCRRNGHELSVVMIDCDGLKAVNDTGGHALGDAVLQRVADCLREHKRMADVAARLGGDEFVVLLPETRTGDALGVAERFRRELAATPFADGRTITAALGIASFPADGDTAAALLRVADRTLYTAKQRGGNRTLASSAAG